MTIYEMTPGFVYRCCSHSTHISTYKGQHPIFFLISVKKRSSSIFLEFLYKEGIQVGNLGSNCSSQYERIEE